MLVVLTHIGFNSHVAMDFNNPIVNDLGNDVRHFLNLLEVYDRHSPNKFLWHLSPCANHFETTHLWIQVCASFMFRKNTPSSGAQHELVWEGGWVSSSNPCHCVLGSPLTTHSKLSCVSKLENVHSCEFYIVIKLDVPLQFWDISIC